MDWEAIAADLGLEDARIGWHEGARVRIDGDFRGRRVSLHRNLVEQLEVRSTRADLVPALDLGLRARPRGMAPAVPSDEIQHVHLDQEYELTVDEIERARRLFGAGLADEVYARHCACESPTIADDFVEIHGWTARTVSGVARLADLVDEARGAVGPAAAVAAHVEAWTELARTVGATITTTPLHFAVGWQDVLLEAHAPRRGKREHQLELTLRLPKSLDAGLSITPTRAVIDAVGVIFGGQDVIVGERAFDDAFRIRVEAERVSALKEALDLGTRALVLGARGAGASIVIDDDGVRATFDADAPPEALPSTVEPLAEALRRITRHLRAEGRAESAYRG